MKKVVDGVTAPYPECVTRSMNIYNSVRCVFPTARDESMERPLLQGKKPFVLQEKVPKTLQPFPQVYLKVRTFDNITPCVFPLLGARILRTNLSF